MSAPYDKTVWIHRIDPELVAEAVSRAVARPPAEAPLSGLTFAIKDNIDLAGVPTTAACPAYAYTPTASSGVVQRLLDAGAAAAGKTNLDQFATGLVGVRSPYGVPKNVIHPDYVPGGSSCGSAVAVASGEVDFSLGTDTAGSGRVPAGLNGILGLKPTRGRLSTRGVVPACRTLDCVSIFARNAATASRVLAAASGFDPLDPYSRRAPASLPAPLPSHPKVGVPRADQLEWFGNAESPALFAAALERLTAVGAQIVEVDFSSFLEAARLLYEGPWVAERYAAVGEFIAAHQSDSSAGLDPTVAGIILGGTKASAVDAFRAEYRLAQLRRTAEGVLAGVDLLAAPTYGTAYTVAEVLADPVRLNSNLGRYNNFMNLLDLCGLTLPAGRYARGPGFGLTLIGRAWEDERLLSLGSSFLGETTAAPNARTGLVELAVCGAHLRGQPLHAQLIERGAQFLAATRTAPRYRLHALAGTTPPKPGLSHTGTTGGGAAIAVETYALTQEAFGRFVSAVPSPLVIGTVELADGRSVKGFLCEPRALEGAQDITSFGGWADFLSSAH